MRLCSFHIHTIFSGDGHISLDGLADTARRHGIGCLFITDHNSIEGAVRFKRLHPEFQTVVGEEIMTKAGEVIGLFLSEKIEPGLGLRETFDAIRAQGGVVALPHPCDSARPSSLKSEFLQAAAEGADVIEVFNGRTWGGEADARAEAICAMHGKSRIEGSDAHFAEEVPLTVFEIDDFTDAGVFLGNIGSARFTRSQKTTVRMRLSFRLKKMWGCYSALTVPERLVTLLTRHAFRMVGGGFVSIAETDAMCTAISRRVEQSGFRPELVIGIAGGGLYPGFKIAENLGLPYESMRISYPQLKLGNLDTDDIPGAIFLRNALLGNTPVLKHRCPGDIRGKRVLLVDDDCTSGRTLKTALDCVGGDAQAVKTAVLRLLAEPSTAPDYYADDRRGAVFRHPRFPWIKYSPEYPRFHFLRLRQL